MKKIICITLFCLFSFLLFSQEKSRREIVSELFESIEEWLGTPYVFGGNTKSGIDCSGFVVKVYKKVFNKTLPRTVADQKSIGVPVKGKLQPGDLVFFNIDGNRISHVGIYVFDGKFIHASLSSGVKKSSLSEKYYKKRYVFARRVIKLPPYRKEEYSKAQKPVISKNEKEKSVDSTVLKVLTGSTLSKEGIAKTSNVFKKDTPFYVQVTNKSSGLKKVSIEIAYQGNIIYDKSQTLIKSGGSHIETMLLDSGTYVLKVYDDPATILYEKLIKVE